MYGIVDFAGWNGHARQARPPNVVVDTLLTRVGSAPLAASRRTQNPELRTPALPANPELETLNSSFRLANSERRTQNSEVVVLSAGGCATCAA